MTTSSLGFVARWTPLASLVACAVAVGSCATKAPPATAATGMPTPAGQAAPRGPQPSTPTQRVQPGLPPRTADDCRACNGVWGVHGLAPEESCNCRTTDGGKTCRDGADCQGMCIAAENPQKEVVEAGPPARGYFLGRCSDLVTVFGCNRLISRGARGQGPATLSELPSSICVD